MIRFSSNLEENDRKKSKQNIGMHIIPALHNKIIKSIEDICDISTKCNYIRITKYKAIILILEKFEEIHMDFWGPHNSPSILKKSYISLLLNEYTQKL